ncbi:hypothetical protein QF021_002260 [Acidovorax delafieldii]|uniref:YfjI family protein n=1 Tax=Acidovorax delafieldii TaxID=47920 RepID=UPI002854ED46|nr:YfjI family protein [Acidovorax delafieldii]MDR6154171.1 hypothetical protein [Acidovorax delafieldii]
MYERKYHPKVHLEMAPKLLRHAVHAADLQTQAPIEIALVSALTAMVLCCQGVIDVRSPPGFLSPVGLYLWVLAMSGERKSTTDKIFLQPIVDREKLAEVLRAALRDRHEAACTVWLIRLKQLEADLAQAVKAAKDCAGLEEAIAEHLGNKPVMELYPRWLYHNTTIEALLRAFRDVWPSAGLVSAEGAIIADSRVMQHLGTLTELWQAPELMRVDRITTGGLCLQSPHLTFSVMTQRAVYDEFVRRNDGMAVKMGFTARLLLCEPISRQGERAITVATDESTQALAAFNSRTAELLEESVVAIKERRPRKVVTYTPEAARVWYDMTRAIESDLQPGQFFHDIPGFASKIAENVSRVAALLQYFCKGTTEIDVDTLNSARDICQFFVDEMKEISSPFDPRENDIFYGQLLDEYLVRYQMTTRQTEVDINQLKQYGPNRIRHKEKLWMAINNLCLLNRIHTEQRGRRTVVVLHWGYI